MLSRPGSRRHFDVVDPSDGSVLATVTDGDVDDAEHAVALAAAAATAWRESPARERAEILRSTFELILRDTEELAELISAESGKSIADARTEVAYAAEFFR